MLTNVEFLSALISWLSTRYVFYCLSWCVFKLWGRSVCTLFPIVNQLSWSREVVISCIKVVAGAQWVMGGGHYFSLCHHLLQYNPFPFYDCSSLQAKVDATNYSDKIRLCGQARCLISLTWLAPTRPAEQVCSQIVLLYNRDRSGQVYTVGPRKSL